jgi:4-alpha-glucanotransferase
MDQLNERAAEWGVETGFFDVQGRRHDADAETLRGILDAIAAAGHPAKIDAWPRPHPQPADQGDGRKTWVLAVQLYAVRSRRNWGHGDFTDLARLLELVAELGGGGVGLNPLHAQFYDRPGSGSPYSPNSRLFFNPLYIDVEAVEEFSPDLAPSPRSNSAHCGRRTGAS